MVDLLFVFRIVAKAEQIDCVLSRQLTQLPERANLVTLVRREGYPVSNVENPHASPCVGGRSLFPALPSLAYGKRCTTAGPSRLVQVNGIDFQSDIASWNFGLAGEKLGSVFLLTKAY